MNRKARAMVEATVAAIEEMGAKAGDPELRNGGHMYIKIRDRGKTRKIFFAATASCPRAAKNSAAMAKRIIREMREKA